MVSQKPSNVVLWLNVYIQINYGLSEDKTSCNYSRGYVYVQRKKKPRDGMVRQG